MTEVPIFYYFESETNTKRPPITNKPFARHQDVKVTPYPSFPFETRSVKSQLCKGPQLLILKPPLASCC
jgi:hypothetical protein